MPDIYVNNNYFSCQNENMAYLLGFIAADGTVQKNAISYRSRLIVIYTV